MDQRVAFIADWLRDEWTMTELAVRYGISRKVADAWSRYVLCCRITAPSTLGVRPWLERTIREYGLPRALRSDNGPPFATTGPGRLSRLAVWWLKLGIALDRVTPGAPQANGRHERFHLTLQQDTTAPPAPTPRAQQRRFDTHRRHFNDERPHEALQHARARGAVPPVPTPLPGATGGPVV